MKESVLQAKLMARCRRAEANNPDFYWVYSYPAGLTLGYRPVAGPVGFRWRRDPSLEVEIVPDWWREGGDG